MKAIWKGQVIAESDQTLVIEGNHYFPPNSIKTDFLLPSETHTVCHWKGIASYYTVEVDGQKNKDAAWVYTEPKYAAKQIKDYIAFWKGVEILD